MTRRLLFFTLLIVCFVVGQASLHAPDRPLPQVREANQLHGLKNATQASEFTGYCPTAIAITKDGKYAYVGFDLSEVVFKVRLKDLTIEAAADLSAYFPTRSADIALNLSETRLFVYTISWRKLVVVDVQTMRVIRTIDDIGLVSGGLVRSQHGPFLITMDGGNTVKLIHTDTYAVTSLTDNQTRFLFIQESPKDPSRWYVVSPDAPLGNWSVGVYDYKAKEWRSRFSVPQQSPSENICTFKVLPNEQKAYLATHGGSTAEGRGYGWLHTTGIMHES